MFSYRTNPSSTFSFLEFVTVDGRAGLTRSTTVTSIGYRHEKSAVNTCPSAANEKIELRTTLSFCSYLWYESLTGSLPDVRQNRSSLGHLLGHFHVISIYFCLKRDVQSLNDTTCSRKFSIDECSWQHVRFEIVILRNNWVAWFLIFEVILGSKFQKFQKPL